MNETWDRNAMLREVRVAAGKLLLSESVQDLFGPVLARTDDPKVQLARLQHAIDKISGGMGGLRAKEPTVVLALSLATSLKEAIEINLSYADFLESAERQLPPGQHIAATARSTVALH